jgi:hypothetical protein
MHSLLQFPHLWNVNDYMYVKKILIELWKILQRKTLRQYRRDRELNNCFILLYNIFSVVTWSLLLKISLQCSTFILIPFMSLKGNFELYENVTYLILCYSNRKERRLLYLFQKISGTDHFTYHLLIRYMDDISLKIE